MYIISLIHMQYIFASSYPPRTRLIFFLPEHDIGEAIISKRFVIVVIPNME